MQTWRTLLLNTLLILLPISSSLCIDMYLPAYPTMAAGFHVDISLINTSMSIYLFGLAIGQLIYGSLSDRFGRKHVLLTGLGVFTLASLICTIAANFKLFLIARLFQALGACSAIVLCRAIVIDLYPPGKVGRILALISASNIFSPVLAPIIGGFLVSHFSWRIIFFLITLFGIIILIGTHYILPETLREWDHQATKFRQIFRNLLQLLRSRIFLGNMLAIAALYSTVFVWVTYSPYIIINVLKIPEAKFGWYFLMPGAGCTLGGLLTSGLANEQREKWLIFYGYTFVLLSSAALALLSVTHYAQMPLTVITLVALVFFGIGMAQPLQVARAIAPFTNMTGFALGIMGSIQTAAGALTGLVTSYFYTGAVSAMAALLLVTGFIATLGFIITGRVVSIGGGK